MYMPSRKEPGKHVKLSFSKLMFQFGHMLRALYHNKACVLIYTLQIPVKEECWLRRMGAMRSAGCRILLSMVSKIFRLRLVSFKLLTMAAISSMVSNSMLYYAVVPDKELCEAKYPTLATNELAVAHLYHLESPYL